MSIPNQAIQEEDETKTSLEICFKYKKNFWWWK